MSSQQQHIMQSDLPDIRSDLNAMRSDLISTQSDIKDLMEMQGRVFKKLEVIRSEIKAAQSGVAMTDESCPPCNASLEDPCSVSSDSCLSVVASLEDQAAVRTLEVGGAASEGKTARIIHKKKKKVLKKRKHGSQNDSSKGYDKGGKHQGKVNDQGKKDEGMGKNGGYDGGQEDTGCELGDLLVAIEANNADEVRRLLAGASDKQGLLSMEKDGQYALRLAAWRGHADVVRELIAAANDKQGLLATEAELHPEATSVGLASDEGHADVVRELLSAIPDKHKQRHLEMQFAGKTALYKAAGKGRAAAVHELLAAAPDKHKQGLLEMQYAGRTPLYNAARRGYADVVRELLAAAPDKRKLAAMICKSEREAVQQDPYNAMDRALVERHQDVVLAIVDAVGGFSPSFPYLKHMLVRGTSENLYWLQNAFMDIRIFSWTGEWHRKSLRKTLVSNAAYGRTQTVVQNEDGEDMVLDVSKLGEMGEIVKAEGECGRKVDDFFDGDPLWTPKRVLVRSQPERISTELFADEASYQKLIERYSPLKPDTLLLEDERGYAISRPEPQQGSTRFHAKLCSIGLTVENLPIIANCLAYHSADAVLEAEFSQVLIAQLWQGVIAVHVLYFALDVSYILLFACASFQAREQQTVPVALVILMWILSGKDIIEELFDRWNSFERRSGCSNLVSQGRKFFKLDQDWWNIADFMRILIECCGLSLLSSKGADIMRDSDMMLERSLLAIWAAWRWVRAVWDLRGFRTLGPRMLPILHAFIATRGFFVVLFFLVLAFSHAYYLLAIKGGGTGEPPAWYIAFQHTYRLAVLGDFDLFEIEAQDPIWMPAEDGAMAPEDPAPSFAYLSVHMFFYACSFIITVLMMNLFIGVLSSNFDTFEDKSDVLFTRARAKLVCEHYNSPMAFLLELVTKEKKEKEEYNLVVFEPVDESANESEMRSLRSFIDRRLKALTKKIDESKVQ